MEITIKLTKDEVEKAIVLYAIRKTGLKLNDVKETVKWDFFPEAEVSISPTQAPGAWEPVDDVALLQKLHKKEKQAREQGKADLKEGESEF